MDRYFVRFRDVKLRNESMKMLKKDHDVQIQECSSSSKDDDSIIIAELSLEARLNAEEAGAEIFDDIQFYPADTLLDGVPERLRYWQQQAVNSSPLPWQTKSIEDVMKHNRASAAWEISQGAKVTVGIIDTGIVGDRPEFPLSRRSKYSKTYAFQDEWKDTKGHGSMCACAAGSSKSGGGRFNGVAPGCYLMSLRSNMLATDLCLLYDWVIKVKRGNGFPGPVVLCNAYARYVCQPNSVPRNHPLVQIIERAAAAGIPIIFAAGNNHEGDCGHDSDRCSPNTIWCMNSLDEVLSVGSVNWDESMYIGKHANSSRGPGEWSQRYPKPDCVAPTYGEILWGTSSYPMEWWGTSGACAQVAGLAALLLEKKPDLTPHALYSVIRDSSRDLGLEKNCQGAGIIDCRKALEFV